MQTRQWCLAIALGTIAAASAQSGAACHKGHVEAGYKMTQMPAPKLTTGIGTSSLKITTQSPAAQAYFSQGVELLHCFWDFEAYRAFKQAVRLDPNAAMAYWGIVESIDNYKAMEEEKNSALEKIKSLMEKASDHEQFYLRALQKKQDKDAKDPDEDYGREMEALIDKYPDDLDAKLFLAISLTSGYDSDGRPKAKALYPLMILRNVLADHPDNAAANHYLIHVLEAGPHASDALHSADVLGGLAPNSGHMVHMPGHIYYKLGDQERARNSFLASMKVDEDYMRREHVKSVDDWNYNHNLSYLIASDAEAGRCKEALEMAAKLDALPANPFLAVGKPTQATTVGATAIRLQIRFGNWQEALKHPVELGDENLAGAPARAYRDGLLTYARGMRALEKRDFPTAARESDALDALQWRLKSDPSDDDDEEENKAGRVFDLLETASLDLRGNLKCAQGQFDQGMALLQNAAAKEKKDIGYNEPPMYSRPELESIGNAYLNAWQFDKARAAFEDELKQRPSSGHALYGIARSYELAGEAAKAGQAYGVFLKSWSNADTDLPMVKHALAAAH